MVMSVMMMTVVVVMIMPEALLYVVLMIFRIRERVIDISSWLEVERPGGPILTLSGSQHQQVCQHLHQPESINQVLVSDRIEIRYKSKNLAISVKITGQATVEGLDKRRQVDVHALPLDALLHSPSCPLLH